MNKWSQSLPSIIELNTKSMLVQEKISSSNDDSDDDSLTDVSAIVQSKSSEFKAITQPNSSMYDQLIAYANSFNLDETVYSVQDLKNQFDSTNSIKIKRQNQLNNNSSKLIPSNFFSTKKLEEYNSDENTTVTDGSKFDWENFHSNEIKLQNISSPIIVCEKTQNHFLRPTIDIQVLRSSTPIIIREVLPRTSQSSKPPIIPKRKIQNDQFSSIKSYPNKQSKQIIIEYDQLNVKIDKSVKQRKEIKRVNPYQYIQRYGSSLCSKDIFHKLFTNIVS